MLNITIGEQRMYTGIIKVLSILSREEIFMYKIMKNEDDFQLSTLIYVYLLSNF